MYAEIRSVVQIKLAKQRIARKLWKMGMNTKAGVKECSNHRKYIPQAHRVWDSKRHGQAIADLHGWYVPASVVGPFSLKTQATMISRQLCVQ